MNILKLVSCKNGTVIMDESDYSRMKSEGWSLSIRVYKNKSRNYLSAIVQKSIEKGSKKTKKIPLARFVIGVTDVNLCVDHIDQNSLNNIRSNLRVCTKAENTRNRAKFRGTSKYKGVHLDAKTKMWKAEIIKDRKKYSLGRFRNETDAALAYDKAAVELHKEFASLNFKEIA
jgi:hypothetical protein